MIIRPAKLIAKMPRSNDSMITIKVEILMSMVFEEVTNGDESSRAELDAITKRILLRASEMGLSISLPPSSVRSTNIEAHHRCEGDDGQKATVSQLITETSVVACAPHFNNLAHAARHQNIHTAFSMTRQACAAHSPAFRNICGFGDM